MKYSKKIMAAILSGVITLSATSMLSANISSVDATSFSQINQSKVFVKQQTGYTCTLAANVMMLRRAAMLRGDKDWSSITESAARPTMWLEGVGMYHEYRYKNMQVKYAYINGSVKSALINALKKHPEGIAIYDWNRPHAILLTDYSNGNFYCSDPANNTGSGRIHSSRASININNVKSYWYVASPSNLKLTSSDTKVEGSYEIKEQKVNENWKVNTDGGVNLRSSYDTYSSSKGIVPNHTTLKITKKAKVDGYTWGYTTYQSKSGWIALDYAKKVNAQKMTAKIWLTSSSVALGDTVTIKTAAYNGKNPYRYTYAYRLNKNSKWTILKKNSSSGSYKFKPNQAKKYELMVEAKDTNNRTVKTTAHLTVTKPLNAQTSVSANHVELGDSVKMKAKASGGKTAYHYSYYYQPKGESTWTAIKTNTTKTAVAYKPAKAGQYNLKIEAKDAKNQSVRKYYQLTVSPKLSSKTSVSKKEIKLGDTITLQCQGKDGIPSYTYAYYYKMSGTDKWIVIKDYSNATSVQYKPKKAGKYELMLKVIDSKKKIVRKYENLTVK